MLVRSNRRGSAPHPAIYIAVGCLLGLLTIVGIVASPLAAMSATSVAAMKALPAACSTYRTNVDGTDAANVVEYGDQGYVYVNTSETLSGLNNTIYRSLFIISTAGNDVEVGWAAGPDIGSPMNKPTLYAEWVSDGTDSLPQFNGTINSNTNYQFVVKNVGDVGIWRFVFSNDSSPFDYSPTMNFNTGQAVTNSEHHNNCDTMWAHFYNLEDAPNTDSWTNYGDYECLSDNSINGWYFNRTSNNEGYVTQTPGVAC